MADNGGNGGGAGDKGGQGDGAQGGAGSSKDDDLRELGITEEQVKALGDKGLAALERLREDRRRTKEELAAASAKAQKYDELENANKTELEKLQQREKDLEAKAAGAESQLLKLSVALEAGLPHTMAARLQGSTKAELEKDAEELAKQLNVGPRRTTNGNAGDGGGAGAEGGSDNMDDWIRGRAGRR